MLLQSVHCLVNALLKTSSLLIHHFMNIYASPGMTPAHACFSRLYWLGQLRYIEKKRLRRESQSGVKKQILLAKRSSAEPH